MARREGPRKVAADMNASLPPLLLLILLALPRASAEDDNMSKIQGSYEEVQPAAFVNISGSFYYISPLDVGYNSALQAAILCNDIGMKLISLETKEKWNTIRNYLNDNGFSSFLGDFWTSGQRSEGEFIWTGSGKVFTYTNWDAWEREPNCSPLGSVACGPDVCVFFNSMKIAWYDITCGQQFEAVSQFMCEY